MIKTVKKLHYKKDRMNKRIFIRCPESTLLLLKKTAKEHNTTVSNYVRVLVEKQLKKNIDTLSNKASECGIDFSTL